MQRIPRFVSARSLWALNRGLDRLETAPSDPDHARLRHPPLFIVGAPRTGSTLLYQLVVHRFDVGYLSNRHCRLYGAPSLVERLRPPREAPDLESRYGRTAGPDAPSECGEYWYRFFRQTPQYVARAEMPEHQRRRLRASIRAFGDAASRPIVFKNLICALRLGPLAKALPEAVFVTISRDLLATATSLLAGRKDLFGDYAHWWSSEPPGIDGFRSRPPHEQVVEQVRRIEEVIERDREAIGDERFFTLTYEGLCEDPGEALARIAALAERNGFRLTPVRAVPARLEQARPHAIDPDLHERLAAYVRDI